VSLAPSSLRRSLNITVLPSQVNLFSSIELIRDLAGSKRRAVRCCQLAEEGIMLLSDGLDTHVGDVSSQTPNV